MKKYYIPWKAWYGDTKIKLVFPDHWNVKKYCMADAKKLSIGDIRNSILYPINSQPISILAKEKNNAVIVVDDITRPTPCQKIINIVVDELKKADIDLKNISIILGVGAHRPMLRDDIIKKIGKKIWENISVFNHVPYDNLCYLGKSKIGTPIYLNKFYYDAEFKIGIGSIIPNLCAGLGGGGKIVLPGVAGIKTILANHRRTFTTIKSSVGKINTNVRNDIEEIAKRSNLNFIINAIVNSKREIADVVAGDINYAYREGVKKAIRIYKTEVNDEEFDIAILNAYPKDTEFNQLSSAFSFLLSTNRNLVKNDGIIIICTASSEGEGYHSLMGPGMQLFKKIDQIPFIKKKIKNRKIIIFSPYLSQLEVNKYFMNRVFLYNSWEKLLKELLKRNNSKCNVCIIPNSSLQLCSD